jgi:hypothetical protein
MSWIIGCLILVVAAANVSAQGGGWRGIVPLHSSCEDVKQILGITECKNRTYDVNDFKVSILFSDGSCTSGWKVSAGTVITLDVHSKVPQQFSDLQLESSQYRKVMSAHLPGLIRYENEERGESITVSSEGFVTEYFYGPSTKDMSLRCQPQQNSSKPSHTGSIKFDEYGMISRSEEEARLNDFAFQLRASDKTVSGYILVYGGSVTSVNEAHERGAKAKMYLVSRGVDATRLVVVDGGPRNESTVELFLTTQGTIPPTPTPPIRQDQF